MIMHGPRVDGRGPQIWYPFMPIKILKVVIIDGIEPFMFLYCLKRMVDPTRAPTHHKRHNAHRACANEGNGGVFYRPVINTRRRAAAAYCNLFLTH